MPATSFSALDAPIVLAIALIFLVPCAAAGLALINTGMGRSRSAAHSMMASLCVISIAALAYFACGFAWQGFAGLTSHVASVSGKPWSWLGAGPFLFRHLPLDGSAASLAA
jgi:Amt family ammonium transporter